MPEEAKSSVREAERKRRAYDPPRLARVDLAADEVLAFGCKQLSTSNGAGSTVNCIIRACGAAGS